MVLGNAKASPHILHSHLIRASLHGRVHFSCSRSGSAGLGVLCNNLMVIMLTGANRCVAW